MYIATACWRPVLSAIQNGTRWAYNGEWLADSFSLRLLANVARDNVLDVVRSCAVGGATSGTPLAPVDDDTEVWAAGVTYLRSREANEIDWYLKRESGLAPFGSQLGAKGLPKSSILAPSRQKIEKNEVQEKVLKKHEKIIDI